MIKDYQEWTPVKAQINNRDEKLPNRGYKVGQIWWCSIGENIGSEEDGKGMHFARPVLIVAGYSRHLFIGIPLSTTKNRGTHYYPFTANDGEESVALLMQIRAFDTSRLRNRKTTISKEELAKIADEVKSLLP
jgi:mRNA-degrading endonuclease toxin of MazEF toxin-antitoxin module